MTRDTEKCPLSVINGVRFKRVNFRENIWAFHWDKRNRPLIKWAFVKLGSTV